ncbi:hypothetical protein G9A89_017329 [Geosiphon pyriformis]|nr:hypothetical protein G9A89_017329 [Geosiphon pyriformis]
MFKKKRVKKEKFTFPDNFQDLGYKIDESEQLTTLDGEPYKFDTKNRPYSEALYSTLIDMLTKYAGVKLQSENGLVKTLLPIGVKESEIHNCIFLSPDYLTNENMCIFIPGTSHTYNILLFFLGNHVSNKFVGVWSRRVMTDLSEGAMIAYTKRARDIGCSVVITNPNEIFWYKGKPAFTLPKPTVTFDPIPENDSPEAHLEYVFNNFVIPSEAKKIFIVASSYGGHCAVNIMQKNFDILRNRVKSIEFTTTTHSIDFVKRDIIKVWIREHCRNWIVSDQPLGEEIVDPRFGCVNYSSGCQLYEYVVHSVIDFVFEHFIKKIEEPDDWIANDLDDEEDLEALEREAEHIFANSKIINVENGIEIIPNDVADNPIPKEELDSNWL